MKALVVAGGLAQIELIRQLKSRKIECILVDGNDNCLAKNYADRFYCIQIFDVDEVKKIAVLEEVDFIITVCADQVLLVVAQVSEMLGLPCYIDYKTAQDVSDKHKMKKIFVDNNIPTSRYIETNELDVNEIRELRYPLVVKPVDAYSSKGVRKAENFEELKKYYKEAAVISRTGGVIIEEFCQGEEISVDAFVVDGKAKILCISNSDKIKDENRFVIFRGKYPVNASSDIINKIEEVAQKIADAFGLINSPLLIQMINDGENVFVLEFCARTGGNTKYLLIKYSSGVDVISATIDLFLDRSPDIEPKFPTYNYVVNDFLYCSEGIFEELKGFEELREAGIINEYHALRPRGTKVVGIRSSSDRIATVNVVAETKDEFNSKLKEIIKGVRIEDVDGNDIMRHDLLPKWL